MSRSDAEIEVGVCGRHPCEGPAQTFAERLDLRRRRARDGDHRDQRQNSDRRGILRQYVLASRRGGSQTGDGSTRALARNESAAPFASRSFPATARSSFFDLIGKLDMLRVEALNAAAPVATGLPISSRGTDATKSYLHSRPT